MKNKIPISVSADLSLSDVFQSFVYKTLLLWGGGWGWACHPHENRQLSSELALQAGTTVI